MNCHRCDTRKRLKRIERELRTIRFLLNRPRYITLITTGELGMAITFAVVLPTPPADAGDWAEIASGSLTVTLPGVDPIVIATAKTDQETDLRLVSDERFVAEQGTLVQLDFHYVDDAGNHGSAASAVVELLDTVPPVAPDNIGLVATGEV